MTIFNPYFFVNVVFYYEILNSPDRACHLAKQVRDLILDPLQSPHAPPCPLSPVLHMIAQNCFLPSIPCLRSKSWIQSLYRRYTSSPPTHIDCPSLVFCYRHTSSFPPIPSYPHTYPHLSLTFSHNPLPSPHFTTPGI